MRRILLVVAGTVLLAAALFVAWAYHASQHVPDFYRQALDADRAEQDKASTEMMNRSSRLVQQTRRHGHWQALFSAQQINGYLAVDFAKQFPSVLSDAVRDPRIAIGDDEATLACQYQYGGVSTVLSLTFDAYLSEPNVVALRIRSARAGNVPLPLTDVLDQITKAAEALELPLRWRQSEGDPVALVTIPSPRNGGDRRVTLEALELRDGEIYIAGQTIRRGASDDAPEVEPTIEHTRPPTVADQPGRSATNQR